MNLPETLSAIATQLREHQERFRDTVHDHFFSTILEARGIFPLARARTHLQLVPALADVLDRTPLTGVVPPHVLAHVAGHGIRHRRHAFPAEAYEPFADSLVVGLRDVVKHTHPATRTAAESALRQVCHAMAEAAREQDLAGVPAAYLATVVHTEKRSRRITVVHLETNQPFEFRPGQALPVAATYLPGTWRMLSPALPANEYGRLEFHVQALPDGEASPLLAAPKLGDHWTFGAPAGNLSATGEHPLLLIAHRMGLAPLRSILFDLLQRDQPVPEVQLVISAEYPGELHDLVTLWNIARVVDWLHLTVVVENPVDPWWMSATQASRIPEGLELKVTGDLGQFVLGLGDWAHHEVLVAGPAEGVHETVRTLFRGGVPAHRVNYEAWL